ncbi:hypothetical protein LTR78_009042 [Recurvomyces mirabilis]|uniref:Uncharacterized protein n=1 Tax=Recurvomyces mirabilis TaxID=574656 RepID=A0AAE0TSE3_9PEZI|nr:hypothetical protein LTR78_009042 [Recurvomyces mirabilis]KAK5150430.1 hypothetical protein LTS14_010120 [Recurvomyces mirabilis]
MDKHITTPISDQATASQQRRQSIYITLARFHPPTAEPTNGTRVLSAHLLREEAIRAAREFLNGHDVDINAIEDFRSENGQVGLRPKFTACGEYVAWVESVRLDMMVPQARDAGGTRIGDNEGDGGKDEDDLARTSQR